MSKIEKAIPTFMCMDIIGTIIQGF